MAVYNLNFLPKANFQIPAPPEPKVVLVFVGEAFGRAWSVIPEGIDTAHQLFQTDKGRDKLLKLVGTVLKIGPIVGVLIFEVVGDKISTFRSFLSLKNPLDQMQWAASGKMFVDLKEAYTKGAWHLPVGNICFFIGNSIGTAKGLAKLGAFELSSVSAIIGRVPLVGDKLVHIGGSKVRTVVTLIGIAAFARMSYNKLHAEQDLSPEKRRKEVDSLTQGFLGTGEVLLAQSADMRGTVWPLIIAFVSASMGINEILSKEAKQAAKAEADEQAERTRLGIA